MRNESVLDTAQSQRVALQLHNATRHTAAYFGSDVRLAYRLAARLLQHESAQRGFRLAATQDVHFTEVRGGPRRAPGPGVVGWDEGDRAHTWVPSLERGAWCDQPGGRCTGTSRQSQGTSSSPCSPGDKERGWGPEARVMGSLWNAGWGGAGLECAGDQPSALGAPAAPRSQGGAELCTRWTWCPPG